MRSSDPRESHSLPPDSTPPQHRAPLSCPRFIRRHRDRHRPRGGDKAQALKGSVPPPRGTQRPGPALPSAWRAVPAAPGSSAPAPPAAGDFTSSVQRSQPVRRQVGWEAWRPDPPCLCPMVGGTRASLGAFPLLPGLRLDSRPLASPPGPA